MSSAKSTESTWGWGLIGPGRFAREFSEELITVPRARLAAVASRSRDRAASFAEQFGFERIHDSYEALVKDPSVDLVYIAVPHSFHREVAQLALSAGKAVVCEKPLTPSHADTAYLFNLARKKGLFMTEAMKTAFLPAIRQAKAWIDEGAIGEVSLLKADFGFTGSNDPEDRLLNPDLAGGCLLDVGVYPLFLSLFMLGEIDSLQAVAHLAKTGVEDTAALSLRHRSGACSVLSASFRTPDCMDASILGTEGEIRIPKFHAADEVTLLPNDGKPQVFRDLRGGLVLAEIEGILDALDAGHLECREHPHDMSLSLSRWVEEALGQVRGLSQVRK